MQSNHLRHGYSILGLSLENGQYGFVLGVKASDLFVFFLSFGLFRICHLFELCAIDLSYGYSTLKMEQQSYPYHFITKTKSTDNYVLISFLRTETYYWILKITLCKVLNKKIRL